MQNKVAMNTSISNSRELFPQIFAQDTYPDHHNDRPFTNKYNKFPKILMYLKNIADQDI